MFKGDNNGAYIFIICQKIWCVVFLNLKFLIILNLCVVFLNLKFLKIFNNFHVMHSLFTFCHILFTQINDNKRKKSRFLKHKIKLHLSVFLSIKLL